MHLYFSTYLDLFEEEYLSDDPDLQEAISRSLESSTSERSVEHSVCNCVTLCCLA